jgi:hypothetical protein
MATATPPPPAGTDKPRRYDLFMTSGRVRFRMKLADLGIEPQARRLSFMLDGQRHSRPYSDMATVTLNSNALPDSTVIGVCRIDFRDGERLLVLSANANGLSDGSRNAEFSAFVRDLHGRLIANGAADAISFRSGFSNPRFRTLAVALAAAALLFLVLPLILFAATGEPRLLLGLVFGVLLILPGARLLGPNRPATYRPEAPPDFFA